MKKGKGRGSEGKTPWKASWKNLCHLDPSMDKVGWLSLKGRTPPAC